MKLSPSLLVLFFVFVLHAIYGNDKKFYNINMLSGMSINETRTVTEDENGFVWAASKSGVLRMTSGDYRFYKLPTEANNILYIDIASAKGILLAYTANAQIFKYNPVLDKFELLINMRKELKRDFFIISQMSIKSKDEIWLATSAGLYLLQGNEIRSIASEEVRVVRLKLVGDDIYYATREKIICFNLKTKKEKIIYENTPLHRIMVSKLYLQNNKLWVGTFSSGLYYIDITDNSFHKHENTLIPHQPILAMRHNIDSSFMIGIDGQGVWQFDNEAKKLQAIYKENLDNPFSISGDGIYDLFVDSKQRVWVSTFSGGLSYFEQNKSTIQHITYRVNNKNSLGNNNVNKLLQARNGDLWFATNNGISRWKKGSNTWNRYLEDVNFQAKVFLTLEEDADGNIWAGTYSSGIYIIDGKTGTQIRHFSKLDEMGSFKSRFVFSIFRDSKNNMWLGGNQGDLYCFMRNERKFRTYSTNFDVSKIIEVSASTLIISSSVGLVKFDVNTGAYEVLVGQNIVNDVLVHNDRYWIGTRGGGLLCYSPDTKLIEEFKVEAGLPSNFINSMVYANGIIWLGTENGLGKFDPLNKNVVPYNEDFQLSRLSYSSNAVKTLDNGDLIWGTSNGVVLFNPQNMNTLIVDAKLFFQDILISGQSIRESTDMNIQSPVDSITKLRLKYYQNTLSLEVLPIAQSIDGLKLSWRIVGIDSKWNDPTNRFFINYANLPSGRFKLEIRLYDNSLTQIIDERFIDIEVTPPFWGLWWFRLLLLLLLGSIIYYYFRSYTNKLRQKHTEEKIHFFTNMAHDIRTSLTLIKAPIDNISNEAKLTDKAKYYVSVASEQINRMSFVVTQLLDLQKVDIGKGQIFLIMVDVVALLKKRIAMFEMLAKNKNLNISFELNCESYTTAIDELKIEKVFDNLLSNAMKFSSPNSNIQVFLVCNSDKWTLTVRDHGLGISKRDQKKLFKEFYRGENSINSRIVGSGIGLLLVKNYVDMHGGSVTVESEEGVGSVFTITIPYHKVDNVDMSTDDIQKENVFYSDNVIEPDIQDEKGAINKMKKPQLLIVEDNIDLQNFLKISLEDDFNVLVSSNGLDAWQIVQKLSPDIIVSDVMMPQMDGFELCRHIKSTFETSHIPIILLTALTDKAQQMEGLGLGADDYITKPFDIGLLNQRIQSLVRNREFVRERVLRMFSKPDVEVQLLLNDQNDQFLKRAIEIVRLNIDNSEFDKDQFAAAMCASTSLLYKKIKTLTGQSPIDFIKVIRLNHSMELLQSRKYSVTEVSEMCGFSSVGYFSTVFKKYFAKSPTDI